MHIFIVKLKESFFSILPIFIIALLLSMIPQVSIEGTKILVFILCSFALMIGMALFNLGADLAMEPMGEHIGNGLAKKKKLWLLLLVVFIFGFSITVAEPDLQVLAYQAVGIVKPIVLIVAVGLGVGVFVVIAVLRLVFKKSFKDILMLFYMLLFGIAILVPNSMIPLAFDSGGVTTGPLTVPFIMALGVGLATVLSGKKAQENSFGLVALCSIGPILVTLLLFIPTKIAPEYTINEAFIRVRNIDFLLEVIVENIRSTMIALSLIVVFFLICNKTFLHLPKKKVLKIGIGILYTFLGLIIFMSSVTIGFMPIGFELGKEIASINKVLLIIIAFIMGLLVVLAEPSVHILVNQVEEVTGGYITKRSLLIGLSIGVGISLVLAMLRIIFSINIMFFIVPGYFISIALSLFIPNIYTAIAFDSGGVASGTMSSTFILPFSIGACITILGESGVLEQAFGIVAMIAMTPLITIQFLGFKSIVASRIRKNIAMKRILSDDDEQIIYFMKED